jgi:hypothetical protein
VVYHFTLLEERFLGRCVRTLRKWRERRIGPPWTTIGRTVVYPIGGFEAWLKANIQQPVSIASRRLKTPNPVRCFAQPQGSGQAIVIDVDTAHIANSIPGPARFLITRSQT